eukprot:TRINITY_DN1269_c0_g2_i1.p1 TRINITY_DN1269_c0_g2~~TRINITY_DN1269_c0_g2_i1.p1  ORF type:complete len:484 (+),score=167.38 TRINITY_DN1269_c0_g2_i1:56-1453(+)
MLAPLGPHISNPRQRPPPRSKAPAVSYVATVWVYTDSVSDAARFSVNVRVPNAATPDQAAGAVWAHYRTLQQSLAAPVRAGTRAAVASTPDGAVCSFLPDPFRPPNQYVLLQAYADGRVDPTQPFLDRQRPLAPQLTFPFIMALCPDPFVVRLNRLERREEERRGALLRAATSWADWAFGYSRLLARIVHTLHGTNRQRVDEYNRLRRKERCGYFAVRELELCREEQRGRGLVCGPERDWRELLRCSCALSAGELSERAVLAESSLALLLQIGEAAAERLRQLRAIASLQSRCARLLVTGLREFGVTARRKRMLYADSRVAQNLAEAQARGVTPEAQRQLRLDVARAVRAARKHETADLTDVPDLVDIDTLLGDKYTSSWLTRRCKEACGGVTVLRRRLSASTLQDPPDLRHRHDAASTPSASSSGGTPRIHRVLDCIARSKPYLGPGRQRCIAYSGSVVPEAVH